jgi:hypothetical protein
MKSVNSLFQTFLALIYVSVLISCGGSSSDNPTSKTGTLSGTAAIGAALSDRTVTVVDSSGLSVTTTTDANGKFSITINLDAAPFMLKVDTDNGPLFSFSAAAGTVNITPVTNLVLYEASKDGANYAPLEEIFDSFQDRHNDIGATELQNAKALVNATISSVLSREGLANATDFFASPFDADNSGIDAVLDSLSIVISGNEASGITIQIDGSVSIGFDPNIDFSPFLPDANPPGDTDPDPNVPSGGLRISGSGSAITGTSFNAPVTAMDGGASGYFWENDGPFSLVVSISNGEIFSVNFSDTSFSGVSEVWVGSGDGLTINPQNGVAIFNNVTLVSAFTESGTATVITLDGSLNIPVSSSIPADQSTTTPPTDSEPTETCVEVLGTQCSAVITACADSNGGSWYEANGTFICSLISDSTSCAQQVVDTYCSLP